MATQKIKVICAMSGGIDSSVSAALLKKAGFDVVGIFIKFWSDSDESCRVGLNKNRCCSGESENRARKIAQILNIPFYILDFQKEFKEKIVDSFLDGYKKGITPNPCVICNKEIKFGLLLEKTLGMGFDFVATGHYAEKIEKSVPIGRQAKIKNQKYRLFTSADELKDQTYFLHRLSQGQLKHILFPVGELTKPQVRKMAKKFKLPVLETPESQEVCFIPGETEVFLKKYLKEKSGNIVDLQGNKLGGHSGLWFYTIGQRKGIGLPGGPYYVVKKDLEGNNLIVAKDEKDLEQKEVIFENPSWISGQEPNFPLKVEAKIRYRHPLAPALISKTEKKGTFKAVFKDPQRAVTPGQAIVFYNAKAGEKGRREVLGGGTIIR
jgi:tRNA-specific 2-thiouridylase